MKYLAKGKRGITYIDEVDGREVVVKEKNPDMDGLSTLKNEYEFLQKLNREGIGPQALSFRDGKLTMEYIDGQLIIDYLHGAGKEEIQKTLRKIFGKLKKMDEMGINKAEMTYPYKHIIIGDEPRMIDFERCRHTETPQNVTQFCQFLMSDRISKLLKKKGFVMDKERVIQAAAAYKKNFEEHSFSKLMEVLEL